MKKCKNYTESCDNAYTCPCFLYKPCNLYCLDCRHHLMVDDDKGFRQICKLDGNKENNKNDN